MNDRVQVKGASKGYKRGAIFEIEGRGTWTQTSSEYDYEYEYRPEALLEVSGSRGRLKLDGMTNWVDVKKV